MKKVEKEKKKVSKKEDVVKVSKADETIEDKVDEIVEELVVSNENVEKGLEIMELLNEFHKKSNHVMIFVTHDDRMAKFADEVIQFEDILVKGGAR